MSYAKKRIEYNNSWPNKDIVFSAQLVFKELLEEKNIDQILMPIQLPLIEDFEFQRLLSFKIDIYEQLPYQPDIGFDLAWRNFEAYATFFSVQKEWTTSKTHKIIFKLCDDILINELNSNINLSNALNDLFKSIPLQATEFLIKRMFGDDISFKSQKEYVVARVRESIGVNLYDAIKEKYYPLTSDTQRKAGMLLQIIMTGKKVIINNKDYTLNQIQILKLLINGILYTYRNERFHGDAFSPFKSSHTQLKTYAHSYYCLIATYFFISQLICYHYPDEMNMNTVCEGLKENTDRFNLIFKNQLRK